MTVAKKPRDLSAAVSPWPSPLRSGPCPLTPTLPFPRKSRLLREGGELGQLAGGHEARTAGGDPRMCLAQVPGWLWLFV